MDRRTFLIAGTAAAMAPSLSLASGVAYTPGLVEKHLAAGDTVFLDFKASWCGTCAAQGRVIDKLKAENAAYGQKVVFIDVDWDQFRKSELVSSLKIPRRSTLVVLKGEQELGRLVADTREVNIKALMDTALGAATA